MTIHKDKDDKFSWEEIRRWGILSRGKLVACLQSLTDVEECKKAKVPYYWGYPVSTYYDLQALKELGVSYVRLDAPLFFEMDEIKKIGIPVRAVPNVACFGEIPTKNGIFGTWIRPEDVELYEDYIDTFEFEDCDMKKESALYRIYAEQKVWNGPLAMIISNIETKAENHLISQDATKIRINCGQRCQKADRCRICERALRLADSEKLRNYLDAVKGEKND